jgi:streptomycin 6-kinase
MITDSFKSNILNIYGTKGKIWLTELPNIVAKNAERFGLSELKPIANLSYNYVISGLMSDTPIILKLSVDDKDLRREASALQYFTGFGAVKIIAEDKGLLLLAKAQPGISLKSYFPTRDGEAIQITCRLIKQLHQAPIPERHDFPHLKDLVKILDDQQNLFDKDFKHYLHKAKKLSDQLLATAEPDVLLHGDLHQDNILQDGNDWIMIDPKGRIGDPAYEAVGFINDPMPELITLYNASQIIQNRIQIFADNLHIAPTRIASWCFVKSVMCWIWALEDNCDATYWQKMAEIFDEIT